MICICFCGVINAPEQWAELRAFSRGAGGRNRAEITHHTQVQATEPRTASLHSHVCVLWMSVSHPVPTDVKEVCVFCISPFYFFSKPRVPRSAFSIGLHLPALAFMSPSLRLLLWSQCIKWTASLPSSRVFSQLVEILIPSSCEQLESNS